MYTYSFEKLEVWQLSRKLIVKTYTLTAKYPNDEKFVLVAQIRRAAISIASNLAEGSSRKSPKERANFYQISFSSLMELLNQFIISCDLGFIKEDITKSLRVQIDEMANKINALRNSQIH